MNALRANTIEPQAGEQPTPLEAIFEAHYPQIARLIAAIIRDRARAEELAVEVFLKWPGTPSHGASAWLHRTAVRSGLDELRRQSRRSRFERVLHLFQGPRTPEEIHFANDQQDRVSKVLGSMRRRDAELLLLRADGMSYEELASALGLHAASIGTLISRAQKAFRKEYTKRYGNPESSTP